MSEVTRSTESTKSKEKQQTKKGKRGILHVARGWCTMHELSLYDVHATPPHGAASVRTPGAQQPGKCARARMRRQVLDLNS